MSSVLVAAVLWGVDQRWSNATVVTHTPKYGEVTINNQPAAIDWIERFPRNERLWQLLLLAWFYPAKILIQARVANCRWQLVGYGCITLAATGWVWGRLVTWDWWTCETIYSKLIGEPLLYLFVPSAFFLYDWGLGRQRAPGVLVLRAVPELLLIIPWGFAWGITQLMLGWLWI